jgi:MprA protease rhombosortase-interaction domain-containing protein
MPKAASALTLTLLMLVCFQLDPAPCRAEEMDSPAAADYHHLILAAQSQGAGPVPAAQGFYHRPVDLTAPLTLEWLPSSLVDEVGARLVAAPFKSRPSSVRNTAAVPPTTGAWLLAAGLAAFVVSRKRFRDR